MSKDIIITNPRLLKLLKWFEEQSTLVQSFLLAVVRFALIALIGVVGLGAYVLGGATAVGAFITFLGVWAVSYLRLGD